MNYLLVLVLRLTEPLTLYTEVLFFSTLKLFLPHQLRWWLSHKEKPEAIKFALGFSWWAGVDSFNSEELSCSSAHRLAASAPNGGSRKAMLCGALKMRIIHSCLT